MLACRLVRFHQYGHFKYKMYANVFLISIRIGVWGCPLEH